MGKVILYTQEDGTLAVCWPSGELPLEETARKDVPTGTDYVIIDESELPSNYYFRDAWRLDPSVPADGTGAEYGIGSNYDVIGYNEDGTPILRSNV